MPKVSEPPLRMQALPVLSASDAMSTVTLGRARDVYGYIGARLIDYAEDPDGDTALPEPEAVREHSGVKLLAHGIGELRDLPDAADNLVKPCLCERQAVKLRLRKAVLPCGLNVGRVLLRDLGARRIKPLCERQ